MTKSDDYMPWRDETVLDIIGDNAYHDALERGGLDAANAGNELVEHDPDKIYVANGPSASPGEA